MASKALINDLRQTYKALDTNNDGSLTRDELREVIKRVITKISDSEIEELLVRLDRNGDNKIDFEEFVKEMSSSGSNYYSNNDLEATFNHFDKDHSGYIDENELFEAMKRFKKDITKDQVKMILNKIDSDHSGKISMDEFITLMS